MTTGFPIWRAIAATLLLGCIEHQVRAQAEADAAADPQPMKYAIVIHGGAGSAPDAWSSERRTTVSSSLRQALQLGQRLLAEGGTSLDAVELVIRFMEDDPVFNAGRGAVFNHQGANELDASIMDGRDRSCGAVGGVRTVKNPISLARLVMTRTPHVLLVADGAEKFAAEMGVELVEPSYFSTDDQRESLQRAQQAEAAQGKEAAARQTASDHLGTVGCVALDRHSNLAAGTSTGGLTNKRYGRLGDSPVIGAGTFADNATCAVSCTGRGEDFIRNAIAFHISALMQYDHKSIQQAVESVITDKQHPIEGGIIAVSHEGAITMQFNTAGMSRGAADSAGRFEIALGR